MKLMVRTQLLYAALLYSAFTQTFATEYHPAKITHIAVGEAYGKDVVIRLDRHDQTSKPSCVTDFWTLRFDGTSNGGRHAYAMALTAWTTGASLTVSGEGVCASGTKEEMLRWIRGR